MVLLPIHCHPALTFSQAGDLRAMVLLGKVLINKDQIAIVKMKQSINQDMNPEQNLEFTKWKNNTSSFECVLFLLLVSTSLEVLFASHFDFSKVCLDVSGFLIFSFVDKSRSAFSIYRDSFVTTVFFELHSCLGSLLTLRSFLLSESDKSYTSWFRFRCDADSSSSSPNSICISFSFVLSHACCFVVLFQDDSWH